MTDETTPIRTTCPYCGVGCGVLVSPSPDGWTVRGDPDHPANLGRLCSKGAALAETLDLEGRLLYPEVAGRRVGWDAALDAVADRFLRTVAEHGPDAVAFYVSGQLLTEDYYVANKLMKGFIGSGNIDTNSRLCMSSAVAGLRRAFGSDTVPGCYEDLEIADLVVLVGSNAAWTHPVLYQRLAAAKRARPTMKVVLVDPRRTATADLADLHLAVRPGTDAWLFHGLLHHLKREDAVDWAWLEAHVEGFGAAFAAVGDCVLRRVAEECGLDEREVAEFFHLFAATPRTVTAFSQGINQSSSGVDKVNAILNVHLATGRVGRPGATPFSLTGQPNAMGGREVGGLANQLAAHMDFDAESRDRVGRFWGAPRLATGVGLKAVDLFKAVAAGRIRALWIMATNPVVSLPEADAVAAALKACEFLVVSEVVGETDTAKYAHVRLPAAAWGEKDGTVTNSERRISRQRAFMELPGEAKPDWWIVTEVAKRMGHRAPFGYAGPADIFREHAALSAFENASPPPAGEEGGAFPAFSGGSGAAAIHGSGSRRDFDLSGLGRLDAVEYDALSPLQWPGTARGGTARLFADGRFFTPSGKARMVAAPPRPPACSPDATHPFVFNTGRIRDQWHTMTRTGKTARLQAHIAEPYVEMHPEDARRAGVCNGGLARVFNGQGEVLARVVENTGQHPGSVFSPIHWTGQVSAKGRVGVVVNATVDSLSGQPEFKHAPVAVAAYPASWHGFVLSREPMASLGAGYWTRVRGKACWRYELAGTEKENPWLERLPVLSGDGGERLELRDPGAGRYRSALLKAGRLEWAGFFEARSALLPPRQWLESLFEREILARDDRLALLAGSPGCGESPGHVVCACFGVDETALRRTIAQGVASVEGLGQRLKAGTNCGSCVPELRALLAAVS